MGKVWSCLVGGVVLGFAPLLHGQDIQFINGDFQNGAQGWSLTPGYQIENGSGCNGTAALAYSNTDPEFPYAIPKQEVKLEPGKVYRFSAWIKTEGIVPKRGVGASVCVECQDADGKTLKWYWTSGLNGTKDWKRIEGRTRPIPENAKKCFVSVFCSPGSVGKAWFDDVEVAPYESAPVGDMCSSHYRNVAATGRVDVSVAICVPARCAIDDMEAEFVCQTTFGEQKKTPVRIEKRDEAVFSLDVESMPMGRSEVGFVMRERGGKELGRSKMLFTRVEAMPKRRVWIDGHGRTIVNGKPFFPLGMFTSGKNMREEYVKGPFNCVMPYSMPDKDAMDFYHTNGVKVIYTLKDIYHGTSRVPKHIKNDADERRFIQNKVRQFKRHPALLAWYLNDEFSIAMKNRLTKRRDLLEELDEQHPTWIVIYQIENLREYMPTFDIIGTDPYPVPDKPLSMVTDWTRKTVDAYYGKRPVWQVPQAFDWGPKKKGRMPTAEEMRQMSWQCIAAGANGLVYYSYGVIIKKNAVTPFEKAWADVCSAASEIKRYIPVILSIEPTPKILGVPAKWSSRIWRKDGSVYLLVVNAQNVESSAKLKLSERFSSVVSEFGTSAVLKEADTLSVSLKADEVAMYRLK